MFNPRRQARDAAAGDIDPATGIATDARQRDLKPLLRLWPFLRPHGWRIAGAGVALVIGAASTLVLGQVLRQLPLLTGPAFRWPRALRPQPPRHSWP